MLSALFIAHALAADPVELAEPRPRRDETSLHRAGRRTAVAGGITTLVAIPAGGLVFAALLPGCSFECMSAPFLGAATTAVVGTVGLGTLAVGGSMLAVDAARRPREVTIAPAPNGIVISGRF